MSLTFKNFRGDSGTQSISITTSPKDAVVLKINGYSPITYRKNKIQIEAVASQFQCLAGSINTVDSEKVITMTQKSGPIDVSSKIIALSSSSFLIDEYVLPSNSDFVF